MVQEDLSSLLALFLLSSAWILSLESLGKTREWEGCEALKLIKRSEPTFLKSVLGDDLMGDRSLGKSEVKESQTRSDLRTLASPFWPPSITAPLSQRLQSPGGWLSPSFFFSLASEKMTQTLP